MHQMNVVKDNLKHAEYGKFNTKFCTAGFCRCNNRYNNIGVIVGAAFSYKCDRVSAIGFDTKNANWKKIMLASEISSQSGAKSKT